MGKMKKMMGLLVALVMVFAMAITACAEGTTYKLTIKNTTAGHTFKVYQVFTGDLVTKDGKKVLSNVVYGENYGTKGEAVSDDVLNAITDAEKFAKETTLTGDPVKTVDSVKGDTEITGLAPGYYIVKEDTSKKLPDGDTYSKYIVQVVGNTEVQVKSVTTTSDKKVKDINDTTGTATDWQDAADYDIGDAIPFKLSATVAGDYDSFKSPYVLNFYDKGCAGLTFNNDCVVKIDGEKITTGYEVTTSGNDFKVAIANLKNTGAKAGSTVTVEYTATLNENANIGSQGNINKSYVEYSNNAYSDQLGKTKEDIVIVFTYKLVTNKVDENNAPLKGAGFTLYKKNKEGTYEAVGEEITGEALTTFEWKGVDDGDYKLVETTTPAGYNTIADQEFTVTAEHSIVSDNPELTSLSGDAKTGSVITFTADKTAGSLTSDVVNKSGSTLPSTGGMGTTLFYVIGGALVVIAGVLLVSRKRASR